MTDAHATEDTLAASATQSDTGRAASSFAGVDALDAGQRVGRYFVIRKLGAGAMGVVYAGYDPKLDRKVALKLLARLDGERTDLARERLRREAQALAKLAHPNVVGVYDVDVHAGQLYIAMEFVAGRTVAAWMRERQDGRRSWRAALDTFTQAGRGLAAAHAAGLIHRDFKPENAMIGDDGRVRVMDFGLARPEDALPQLEDLRASWSEELGDRALATPLTHTGAMMGTPAYMAPEQFEGKADARSDQFGFCVALYEALYGARPFPADSLARLLGALTSGKVEPAPRGTTVPAWLRAVVLRGLAPEPERRWPSMDALLDALADDPAQRRRRWAGVGLSVALVAGAVGGALWSARNQAQACAGFEARLAGVWDEPTRARVAAAFDDTGLVYAEASFRGAAQRLDEYTQQWVAARRDACEATQRGEQSGELLDLRMACLDERLQHVAATVELFEQVDAGIVDKAVEAVADLPRLDRCADVEALTAEQPPPDDPDVAARVEALDARLIESQALERAGKYGDALTLATEAATEAEGLDYEPLQARAWLLQGSLQDRVGGYAEAEATLRRAYASALGLTMTPEAAKAATRLVFVVGYHQARHADGRRWAEDAGPLVRAAGSAEDEAVYLNSLGLVARAEGDYDEARAYLERALANREQALGPDHPQVTSSLNNLGVIAYTQGNYDEARAYWQRALAIREQALGPDHPHVATSLNNLASVAQADKHYDEARARYERALAIRERALGPDHPETATSRNNLGVVAQMQGDYDEARARYERALTSREQALGLDHPDVASSLNNLGVVATTQGEYDDARAYYQRALAIWEQALGPDHPQVASVLDNLGKLSLLQGDFDDARARYERTLAIQDEALGPDHPEVGDTLTDLGEALLGLERAGEALPLLERALTIRAGEAGDPVELASTRFALARALWDAPADGGRDRSRARELAELAAAAFEAGGEQAADGLAEVRAWQADHSP